MDTVPGEAASGSWAAATAFAMYSHHTILQPLARLDQSVQRRALNLVVVGSSPTVGVSIFGDVWFLCRRACAKKPEVLSDNHLWAPSRGVVCRE